jgi:dTMP kinase
MSIERGLGLLVVIEGIDGGGKTTLQRGLARALRDLGHTVVETKEPTEGPLGQKIRALAAGDRSAISAEEEFSLFHEDRKIHVETVVLPALQRREIVIQDRSYFSTVAYQGERGLDREELLEKSKEIAPAPDLLLVVDLAAERALERIRAHRSSGTDDFEKLESLARIRSIFQDLDQAHHLDGSENPSKIMANALEIILKVLSEK